MEKQFRWGIIGGGVISVKFAEGLSEVTDGDVWAVASKSGKMINQIRAKKYYESYEELVLDPDIDAIYIGTIHPFHKECVKLCLEAGKPVLCEKPISINARECREMIELSRKYNTFLMEAMWTRLLPASIRLKEIIQKKLYGKVKSIHASFGFPGDPNTERLFKPELGGGALLDIGIYGVSFAHMILEKHPTKIHAWANKSPEQIDLTTSVQFEYEDGCVVELLFSIDRRLRNEAYVITENTEIQIPVFWKPEHLLRYTTNESTGMPELLEDIYLPIRGNGYCYEAEEVQNLIQNDKIESDVMKLDDSLKIMETMDQIRKQCGIIYPTDLL